MKLLTGIVLSIGVGSSLVLLNQPSLAQRQDQGPPSHVMIPKTVGLDHLQEFKDAATLHLNDVQKGMDSRLTTSTNYIAKTIYRDVFVQWITRIPFDQVAGAGGGAGSPGGAKQQVKNVTPAELAALYYTFNQGVETLAKHKGQMTDVQSNPMYIEGKISAKDLGMSPDQFRAAVMQYTEAHPMRFWNEARVGLASGR